METSLHRALKRHYAAHEDSTEVAVSGFRIDAIDSDGVLVEVQHAGLGSIRKKVMTLRSEHRIRVIKPLIRTKWIENYDPKKNELLQSRRKSPKRCTHLDLFQEMLHFTSAFPHPNLTLEVPLVDIVEKRVPKVNRRWRRKQYRVLDQTLVELGPTQCFHTPTDLWELLSCRNLESRFDTRQLAEAIDRPRWSAQQIAYVLLKCGAIAQVGKVGNSKIYSLLFEPAFHPKVVKRKRRKSA